MNEHDALLPFRGRKSYSIPRTLQHWLYFKRHLLEKTQVREYFQKLPLLDKKDFREELWRCPDTIPDVYGPRFCRLKSRASRERNQRELVSISYQYYLVLLSPISIIEVRPSNVSNGGLGIFLRGGEAMLSFQHDDFVFPSVLWGLALDVDIEDYELLVDSNYPSLLDGHRAKRYIIAGPLALVNHACKSELCFTSPRRSIDTELPEEFAGIPTIRLIARRDTRLESGKELFVDYFCNLNRSRTIPTVFGEPCRCFRCEMKVSRGSMSFAEH